MSKVAMAKIVFRNFLKISFFKKLRFTGHKIRRQSGDPILQVNK